MKNLIVLRSICETATIIADSIDEAKKLLKRHLKMCEFGKESFSEKEEDWVYTHIKVDCDLSQVVVYCDLMPRLTENEKISWFKNG